MAIKTPNKALNIRVGKVSGNTDIFVFGLKQKHIMFFLGLIIC
jgi:hypothetical protein